MLKLGSTTLEGRLGLDSGHRDTRVDCGVGKPTGFSEYRATTIDTVLGPVRLCLAYHHCTEC